MSEAVSTIPLLISNSISSKELLCFLINLYSLVLVLASVGILLDKSIVIPISFSNSVILAIWCDVPLLSLCDRLGRGNLDEDKIKDEKERIESFKAYFEK